MEIRTTKCERATKLDIDRVAERLKEAVGRLPPLKPRGHLYNDEKRLLAIESASWQVQELRENIKDALGKKLDGKFLKDVEQIHSFASLFDDAFFRRKLDEVAAERIWTLGKYLKKEIREFNQKWADWPDGILRNAGKQGQLERFQVALNELLVSVAEKAESGLLFLTDSRETKLPKFPDPI